MSQTSDTQASAEARRKVGDILRDTRIIRDEELIDVAKALAIRFPFMEAIEENRPRDLPGAAYALGFVRSYAEYLGLDSKAIVERYKEEAKELEQETLLHFPEPMPSRRVPIGALLFIGIILVILFYGVWWYLNNQGKTLNDLVQDLNQTTEQTALVAAPETSIQAEKPVPAPEAPIVKDKNVEIVAPKEPESQQTEATTNTAVEGIITPKAQKTPTDVAKVEPIAPVKPTSVETAPTEAAPVDTAQAPKVAAVTPTETAPTASETSTPEGVEEPVVAEEPKVVEEPAVAEEIPAPTIFEPDAVREPKTYGKENTGSRVTLFAVQSAWVEVSNAQGDLTLTRLLRQGDRYQVPNTQGHTMVTGNAGGIMIVLDGKNIETAGPIGAVRRDYSLDASAFEAAPLEEPKPVITPEEDTPVATSGSPVPETVPETVPEMAMTNEDTATEAETPETTN